MKQFGFPKAEHLCLRRDIEALFAPGAQSFSAYPLRLVARPADAGRRPAVRVLLAVPKRRLRHAVDRNRAKRQLRDAYRLNKHLLLNALPEGAALNIGFLWQSNRPVETAEIAAKVRNLLLRVAEQVQAKASAAASAPRKEEDTPPRAASAPRGKEHTLPGVTSAPDEKGGEASGVALGAGCAASAPDENTHETPAE